MVFTMRVTASHPCHSLPKVLLLLEQVRMHPLVSCVLTSLHKVSDMGVLLTVRVRAVL